MVATKLVEVAQFFTGPEIALPKAKLHTVTKAEVEKMTKVEEELTIERSAKAKLKKLAYGFAGPAGSLDNLEDSARVAVVYIGLLSEDTTRVGEYDPESNILCLNHKFHFSIFFNPNEPPLSTWSSLCQELRSRDVLAVLVRGALRRGLFGTARMLLISHQVH
jgi:hypothetical protein